LGPDFGEPARQPCALKKIMRIERRARRPIRQAWVCIRKAYRLRGGELPVAPQVEQKSRQVENGRELAWIDERQQPAARQAAQAGTHAPRDERSDMPDILRRRPV